MDKLNNPLKIGDTITIGSQYKRRTFWQWLRNEPKALQEYKIVATNESYSEYVKPPR